MGYTVCPKSSDPFYIVSYYIKWVTTSGTYSITQSMNIRNQIFGNKKVTKPSLDDITDCMENTRH